MLGKFLSDYEDCNLTNYLDYNTNRLIFNNANSCLIVCIHYFKCLKQKKRKTIETYK